MGHRNCFPILSWIFRISTLDENKFFYHDGWVGDSPYFVVEKLENFCCVICFLGLGHGWSRILSSKRRLVSSSWGFHILSLHAFSHGNHSLFPMLCSSIRDKRQFSKVYAFFHHPFLYTNRKLFNCLLVLIGN